MELARVQGQVVSTVKHSGLTGFTLLLLRPQLLICLLVVLHQEPTLRVDHLRQVILKVLAEPAIAFELSFRFRRRG